MISFTALARLFFSGRQPVEPPALPKRVWDFRKARWGHSINLRETQAGTFRADGHGPDNAPIEGADPAAPLLDLQRNHGGVFLSDLWRVIRKGDEIIVLRNGVEVRCRVDQIDYCRDPRDQFFATLTPLALEEAA